MKTFLIISVLCCSSYLRHCSARESGQDKIISLDLPHNTVAACSEEQLLFKCTTNATILRWTVTVPLVENDVALRGVSYTTVSILPITIESYPPMGISFNVSRLSANGTLPLMSTLAVSNVTIGLNGTEIECSPRSHLNISSMVATIHVIDSGSDVYPRSSLDINRTEIFMANTITVILEWKEEAGVTYTVDTFPGTLGPLTVENERIELKLFCNIVYSVNITARLCGRNSVNTSLNLSYVRCFDTFREGLMHSADSGIYLVGAIVTFACPPGQVLIGRNTSTCKGNGEWEPDPREVECKANCGVPSLKSGINLMFNSTLEGSQLIIWCDKSPNETMIASCLMDGRWSEDLDDYSCATMEPVNTSEELVIGLVIAMVSSIILFTTISFILGCVFGRLWQKRKQPTETSDNIKDGHSQSSQAALATGDIITPTEQDLEMMENVAYGPLKCTAPK